MNSNLASKLNIFGPPLTIKIQAFPNPFYIFVFIVIDTSLSIAEQFAQTF
jgi:hypothetical protein